MSYREKMPVEDKFKQVKITFGLRIEEVLYLVVRGADFLKPHQSWADSFFDLFYEHIKQEDGIVLERDPDFGNMLRELDAILLESGVRALFIRNIQKDLGFEAKKYRDRKLATRKPMENLERFLVSN
jgi:hypothetical protein